MLLYSANGHLFKDKFLNPHAENHSWMATYDKLFSHTLPLPDLVGLPRTKTHNVIVNSNTKERPGNLLKEYENFDWKCHELKKGWKSEEDVDFDEANYIRVLQRACTENKLILSPCFFHQPAEPWGKNKLDKVTHQSIISWLYYSRRFCCPDHLVLVLPESNQFSDITASYYSKIRALSIKHILWISDGPFNHIDKSHFYLLNGSSNSVGYPLVFPPRNVMVSGVTDGKIVKYIDPSCDESLESMSICDHVYTLDYPMRYMHYLNKVDRILFERIVQRWNCKILQSLLCRGMTLTFSPPLSMTCM